MSLGTRNKGPLDTRTYSIDWTAWLAGLAGTDTITSSTWVVPSPLSLVSQSNSTVKTNVRISGGVVPTAYTVQNTVTTTLGETKQVSFQLSVQTP